MAGRWRNAKLAELIEAGELPAGTRLGDVDENFTLVPAGSQMVTAAGTRTRQWDLEVPEPRPDEDAEALTTRRLSELNQLADLALIAAGQALINGNAGMTKSVSSMLKTVIESERLLSGKATARTEQFNVHSKLSPEALLAHAERLQSALRTQLEQRSSRAIESGADDA